LLFRENGSLACHLQPASNQFDFLPISLPMLGGLQGSDSISVCDGVVPNIPGMLGPHRNAIAPRAWVKSGAATGLMRPVRIPIDEVRVLNSRRLWLPLEAAQAIS
jgi:hypothetical protein